MVENCSTDIPSGTEISRGAGPSVAVVADRVGPVMCPSWEAAGNLAEPQGNVRIWPPLDDDRLTVWKATQELVAARNRSEEEVADLLHRLGADGDRVLAARLAVRDRWTQHSPNIAAHAHGGRQGMISVVRPSELIARFGDYVERRAATILVGAGLSQGVGYPGWSDLLEEVRKTLELCDMDDLPLIAQYYISEYGDSRLQQLIRTSLICDPPPEPGYSHECLAKLPLAEIWTTNYDDLIERAIGDEADIYVVDGDLARAGGVSGRRIYKMHGSLDPPETPLVVARSHYEQYPYTHQRFWRLLQASFLTKSFLFLGFSFDDPNFLQVFQAARSTRDDIRRQHFALVKRPGEQERLSRFDYRLKDLQQVGIQIGVIDDYDEIESLLKQLEVRCRPRGLFVSGSPTGAKQVESGGRYPSKKLSESLSAHADRLGKALARIPLTVRAAGEFGARVGYSLLNEVERIDRYRPERFVLSRRHMKEDVDPPSRRYGSIVFGETHPNSLRAAALTDVRGLLAVEGGTGVATEIRMAKEQGIGVIPVGKFGGSALVEWNRVSEDFQNYRLGGFPVSRSDFNLLRDGNDDECSDAAVRLVSQALYCSQGE